MLFVELEGDCVAEEAGALPGAQMPLCSQVKRVGSSSASLRGALLSLPRPGTGSGHATWMQNPLAHPTFGHFRTFLPPAEVYC